MSFLVRRARIHDVDAMTRLIEQRRECYERLEPVFWKRAAGSARTTRWFYTWLLLLSRRTLALVADREGELLGFLIARRARTPPVYDPGGATAIIDDFCVARPELWMQVGRELLAHSRAFGRSAGWSQIIVVCGALDEPKAALLRTADLTVVTNWWRGPA
jgi:GNAT superfamily N-acetyltransferase